MKKERDLITSFMNDMKDFCKELDLKFWYEKYADVPISRFSNKGYAGGKRFVDTFGAVGQKPFAIEWKLHKSLTGFAFDKVHDEQIEALMKAQDTGWASYLAIGQVVNLKNLTEKQIKAGGIDKGEAIRGWLYRIYFMRPDEWRAVEDAITEKSVKLQYIPRWFSLSRLYCVKSVKDGKSVWDVGSVILNQFGIPIDTMMVTI